MLQTLADAGHYATALPKAAQERPEWQTAAETLFADIAMRKALNGQARSG